MGGAVTSVGGEGADEGEGAHDDAKLAGTKVVTMSRNQKTDFRICTDTVNFQATKLPPSFLIGSLS